MRLASPGSLRADELLPIVERVDHRRAAVHVELLGERRRGPTVVARSCWPAARFRHSDECKPSSRRRGKEKLGSSFLHWDGVDVLRVGRFGEVESLVRHPGQGVLHVVAPPIGRWQADLEAHAVAKRSS